jgi:DNA replication protein DnaC
MTTFNPRKEFVYYAYLKLSGFPTKSIFMNEDELDYSAIAETRQVFDDFADIAHPAPWIYVWSRAKGSGKTMLAARCAIRHAERLRINNFLPSHDGVSLAAIRFAYVPEVLVRVRDTMAARSFASEERILRPLKAADFLVLDDIGAEKASDFSARVLADIVNARNMRPERPMIITANMGLNGLAKHLSVSEESKEQAERIVDRIHELAHVIELPDQNFRAKSESSLQWKKIAQYVDRLAEMSPVLESLRAEVGPK